MPDAPPAASIDPLATSTVPLPWWLAAPARRGWQVVLALLATVICWLAFSPAPPPQVDTGWDKANHALAFATLAVTAELAFWTLRGRRWRNAAGLMAFGAFIEVVQSRIPGRSGEWPDLVADAVGVALGLLAVSMARRMASH
jgi:VanZ family protein